MIYTNDGRVNNLPGKEDYVSLLEWALNKEPTGVVRRRLTSKPSLI